MPLLAISTLTFHLTLNIILLGKVKIYEVGMKIVLYVDTKLLQKGDSFVVSCFGNTKHSLFQIFENIVL